LFLAEFAGSRFAPKRAKAYGCWVLFLLYHAGNLNMRSGTDSGGFVTFDVTAVTFGRFSFDNA
jgi:hypothetical protein